ncbi:MAG: hypothetical protein FH756_20095 [Firmicutes bacterium]|nr:hypothetical protein [Bacillota bacterium]
MEKFLFIKEDILTSLEKEIQEINWILLQKLKKEKSILNTFEFIKISFSTNLLEDINFLNMLSGKDIFKIRHANIIIRDLLEQVIEFIYIAKNPETINDYMGTNINIDELDSQSNLVKGLLNFGKKRYTNGRKSISKMADDINQKINTDENLSLYDMYRILSEQCHNSYFNAILDEVGECETGESDRALTEEQVTYIVLIINHFLKAYR